MDFTKSLAVLSSTVSTKDVNAFATHLRRLEQLDLLGVTLQDAPTPTHCLMKYAAAAPYSKRQSNEAFFVTERYVTQTNTSLLVLHV